MATACLDWSARKLPNLAVRLSLLVCLALPVVGQTEEWKTYKNTDGKFAVLLPGEPRETISDNEDGSQTHTLLDIEDPSSYSVVYTRTAKGALANEAGFKLFQKALFESMPNCYVAAERPVFSAVSGYIGHGYRLACNLPRFKWTALADLYLGKHYAYVLIGMFPADIPEPPTIKKFLSSFCGALLTSSKKPSQAALTASANSSRKWTDFRSQEGNFAAQFPQPPEDELIGEEKGIVITRDAKTEVDNAVFYNVIYSSFAKEQSVNEAGIETVKNGIYKGLGNCMTVSQSPAAPALEGYMGQQYKAQCTTKEGTKLDQVLSLYLGKWHAYSMTVIWRTDRSEPAHDEKRFLASIRLLDPAK